jgi:large subunit ribosomal protein L1
MELKQALAELRKIEKRNFEQSFDLVINLKDIDVKKDNISAIIALPHAVRDKKICAFLTKKSELVTTVTQLDFVKYKEKNELKRLVKEYDFFIAAAKLMPAVATTFGKILGPAGKMPSPQLGVLMQEDDAAIKELLARIQNAVKIKVKEPSVKLSIGKERMSDEAIIANIETVYRALVAVLPIKKDNVKSVMLKLSMSAPLKVEL